jgi:hypothetical protein
MMVWSDLKFRLVWSRRDALDEKRWCSIHSRLRLDTTRYGRKKPLLPYSLFWLLVGSAD